ncbi:MAG: hypothetical protein U1E15_03350 [Hyphomicrobiales bacterium]
MLRSGERIRSILADRHQVTWVQTPALALEQAANSETPFELLIVAFTRPP